MSYFYEHSLKKEILFEHIGSLIEANVIRKEARIKNVCYLNIKNDVEQWRNGMTCIRLFAKDEVIEKDKSRIYPGIVFSEEWISVEDVSLWLKKLSETSKAIICGREVNYELNINNASFKLEFSNREFYSSKHSKFDFPHYWYTSTQFNQIQTDTLHKPLIDFDQPFFESGVDALRSWFDERSFRDVSDAQRSVVYVFVPEPRAYFGNVLNDGNKIKVEIRINSIPETELKLKGSWRKQEEAISFEREIKNGHSILEIPNGFEELYLYVIDKKNKIYDFHQEHKVHFVGQGRWLVVEKQEATNDELINGVCLTGEGEMVEFKEYVEEKESKILEEVRKTVVAFANGKGGIIFLGIDNECQIVGVEKQFKKYSENNGELLKELKRYEGWLRQKINDGLYKTLSKPIEFNHAWKNGHMILIVSVPEGENKPYSNKNKIPYVRHGANTVIADPETEVQAMRPASNGDGGLLGTE